jgi:hypothetical protein
MLNLAKASRSGPDGEHKVSSCDKRNDLDGDVQSGEPFQRRSWSQLSSSSEQHTSSVCTPRCP